MATKQEIEKHLHLALEEIGEIKPWFDKEVNEWVFSHPLYPAVEYGGKNEQEVINNYPRYLREFILHRLDDRVADIEERETKGRGGKREGAGRPKGSVRSEPSATVRLTVFVARWVKAHEKELAFHICKDEKALTKYITSGKRLLAESSKKRISKKKRQGSNPSRRR